MFCFFLFFLKNNLKKIRIACGQTRGCLRASHAQAGSKPRRNPAHELSSNACYGGGVRCSCASSRPMRRDGGLIPFFMTFGLLPILTRIVASLILKWYSCSFLWSSYHSWVSLGRGSTALLCGLTRIRFKSAELFFDSRRPSRIASRRPT